MRLIPTSLLDFINVANVFETPFIDWLNLTSRRPEKLISHQDRLQQLYKMIDIFEGVSFVDVSGSKSQLTFDSVDGTIRLVVTAQHAQVQFRGSYFILHFFRCWDYLLHVYKRLMETTHYQADECPTLAKQSQQPELLNNWIITRTDIKKDKKREIKSLLPIISEDFRPVLDPACNHKYKFGFEASFQPFIDKKGKLTGYKTRSKDWTLTIYDKVTENSHQKNKVKQSAFSVLYAGADSAITRIELRLDGNALNNFATVQLRKIIFAGEAITQKEFCEDVLKKFYDKRRCYLDTGKHKKREDDEPRWLEFFNPKEEAFSRSKVDKISFKTESELDQAKRYFTTALKKAFQVSKSRPFINNLIDECAHKALQEVQEFEKALKTGAGATEEEPEPKRKATNDEAAASRL